MSSRYVDELLVSLKELFKTSAYSDLIIACGDDEHRVHRAVVYPRSKRLVEMSNNRPQERDDYDILVLAEDDPQAVSLMLHYLYHLDYPEVQGETKNGVNGQDASQANPVENFSPLEKKEPGAVINGNADNSNATTNGQPQRPMEYSIENEQFVDPVSSPIPAGDNGADAASKKSKKKKRRNTQAESDSSSAAVAVRTQTQAQSQEPLPAGAATAQPSNLAVHAQLYALASKYAVEGLYALASKYAVEGLKALAAERFERGIGLHWETEDFLRAAREAYTSTDRADRRLRDAVLGAIKAHPQLLERTGVQEVIRGLELSFDLLMHMRSGPNWAAVVGGGA
ncbi:hypothetical protein DL764_000145 [Monosporascus ibericus]|uniref:BTB domain-containing protein n=1 Tax=Monosporascus ibericus TaxID=155417 RepID=A0A4Q4TYA5_9PEZI|nr:hypothetical protein DL764_000145 [Monosporascus ibericus]